jgi:hypothetical protein
VLTCLVITMQRLLRRNVYQHFYVPYSTLLHLPPSDSTVSEDAGIEPRTVATLALTARRSTTRLDFIRPARSHLHSARSHPVSTLGLASSTLGQISFILG